MATSKSTKDNEEKVVSKVEETSLESSKENQEEEATKDPKSDSQDTKQSDKEVEWLKSTVSALQKKVDETDSFKKQLAGVLGLGEEEDKKELSTEDLLSRIETIEKDKRQAQLELQKDVAIDSLEGVSAARKRELKRRVDAGSDDLHTAIEQENAHLDELLEQESQERKASDSRPSSNGVRVFGSGAIIDAKDILKNKDKYRQEKGLA